jgi:hypothetical protein
VTTAPSPDIPGFNHWTCRCDEPAAVPRATTHRRTKIPSADPDRRQAAHSGRRRRRRSRGPTELPDLGKCVLGRETVGLASDMPCRCFVNSAHDTDLGFRIVRGSPV